MLTILSGCSKTAEVSVVDGSGFAYVPFKRESKAYLINNDLEAWKAAKGNNEVCMTQPGCRK